MEPSFQLVTDEAWWLTALKIGIPLLSVFVASYAAWVASRAAKISERAAEHAAEAVEVTRLSSEQGLRAYLLFEKATVEFAGAGPYTAKIEVTFKNTGPTPALDVKSFLYEGLFTVADAEAEEFGYGDPDAENVGGSVIGHGQTITKRSELKLTEKQHAAVRLSGIAIFAWGFATYTDIFGRDQRVEFRQQFTGRVEQRAHPMIVSSAGNTAT